MKNSQKNKIDLFWQYPVITEKKFYEQEKHNLNYIGVPWATIIDKQYKNKQYKSDNIYKYLSKNLKKKDNGKYYTCCQHVCFRRLIPLWKKLRIKTVYASHKIIGEDYIDGIKIKPCPLYAVNIEDESKNKNIKNYNILNFKRTILYSFVGSYTPSYISDIRKKIFNLPKKDDNYILNRGETWHFNEIVYHPKQNKKGELNESISHNEKTYEYNELLMKSVYTLCPSGSGPNNIRFWEALGVGSIPVLLSDTLELPKHNMWNDTIIKLKENDINNVDNILRKISQEKVVKRRINCIKLYEYFKNNYKG